MRLRRASVALSLTLVLVPIVACAPTAEELEREAIWAEYSANPDSIQAEAQQALAEGRWQDVIDTSEAFAIVADSKLVSLADSAAKAMEAEERKAQEQELLAEQKRIPASDPIRNRDVYQRLRAVNPDEPLYKEKYDYYNRKIRENNRAATRTKTKENRLAYAETLEDDFLDEGLDIYVSVHGAENTTLRLKWVLASRVTAHQLQTQDNFYTWRSLGFRRVELRDGYNYSVYWDL